MNKADKDQLLQYLKTVKGKGINKIYLHWTAGRYDQVFSDYHICIKGDGVVWFTTDNLAAVLEHTWRRNTKAIGVALCGCYDAQYPNRLGTCPPTESQIETMSEIIAVICRQLGIANTIANVMTHAEVAAIDGYGPGSGNPQTKWDLYQLRDYDGQWKPGGDVLRGKAAWYMQREA